MKTKLVLALGLVVVITVLAVALVARNGTGGVAASQPLISSYSTSNEQGIWVSGEGKVTVTPDIAMLNLGVSAQASTVAEAQSQAAASMNKVISALTSNGVDKKDIQTQYFSIQQITPYPTPIPCWPCETPSGSAIGNSSANPTILPYLTPDNGNVTSSGESSAMPIKPPEKTTTGFEVTNTVTVKIRAIDKTGAIIDAVVEAGGDNIRIDGVSFSIDQPNQYYVQARQLAMNDAKTKASQLAQLAGVTLGKATYISETSNPIVYPEVYNGKDISPSANTSISPGQMDITVDVQVAYAIQ